LQNARASSKELGEQLSRREGDLTSAGADASSLRAKLQDATPDAYRAERAVGTQRIRLGRARGVLRSRVLFATVLLVALAFALDYAVGQYQHYRMNAKRLAALQLRHAAYEGLFVEVVNVAYEPDQKSYRLTLKMTNVEPDRPIYVMQSPVRVFEQSGLSWKEVPSRAPDGEVASVVVKLTGPHTYVTIFEPNLKDWTELMPGYMHIRFEGNSLISQRSDPDDDIVERTDRSYVYLKPHGADDEAVRKRMKYQGEPPVYIPMPPH
jgi:hypothetical protein